MNDIANVPDRLDLESFIPYRIYRLADRLAGELAKIYAGKYGLTVTEWRIMAVLGSFEDLSANDVATRGALDKVAVSRAVARMVEEGLLDRRMASEDRRRSVLNLSAKGREVYAAIAPQALAFEQEMLQRLSPADREALMELLARLEVISGITGGA